MGFRLKGDDSPGFLALNRNKRSIALTSKNPADRDGASTRSPGRRTWWWRMAAPASPTGWHGYETRCGRINPRLIYASISGFARRRPWAKRAGLPTCIAQAMSGLLSATGMPGQEPVKNTTPVGDLGAALFATYGILSA